MHARIDKRFAHPQDREPDMRRSQLDPITQLDALADATRKQFAFAAKTPAAARAWQKNARAALKVTLGFLDQKRVPLAPKTIERVDRGTYVRQKVMLRTSASSVMPTYVLIPKTKQKSMPCVLALHGHGYGVRDIVGIRQDNTNRDFPEGYHDDFAVQLAKRGFIVVAPEISCFGERMSNYEHLEQRRRPTTCHNANTYAMMLGGSVAGIRAWDGMRTIDYLETIAQADTSRLGVMGISGGGMHAFFSACLDERIKAAVISGYFCDWRQSILAINHCTCNFVPGLLKLGELSDLAGLVAPRPLLVENGMRDDIFPIDAVKKTVKRSRAAWKVFGADKNVETDYFDGAHQIHGVKAYSFLQKHLTSR
jgi:dienelactone hydrolase